MLQFFMLCSNALIPKHAHKPDYKTSSIGHWALPSVMD